MPALLALLPIPRSHSPRIGCEEGDGEADLTTDARVQGPVHKGVVQKAPAGLLQVVETQMEIRKLS